MKRDIATVGRAFSASAFSFSSRHLSFRISGLLPKPSAQLSSGKCLLRRLFPFMVYQMGADPFPDGFIFEFTHLYAVTKGGREYRVEWRNETYPWCPMYIASTFRNQVSRMGKDISKEKEAQLLSEILTQTLHKTQKRRRR